MGNIESKEAMPADWEQLVEGVFSGTSPERGQKREFLALPEDITEDEINVAGPFVYGHHPIGALTVDYTEKVEWIGGKPYFRFMPGNDVMRLKERGEKIKNDIEKDYRKGAVKSVREGVDETITPPPA